MKREKTGKRGQLLLRMQAQMRENKSTFFVYIVLRAFVLIALAASLLRGHYESVFYCLLTLVLFQLPMFVQANFGIELPSTLEIIILLFIFAAEILGELQCYYLRVAGWDTMLHTVNGFLCAAVGFALVDIFNRNRRFTFELSPLFMAIVAFCFSMTIGVLWEFFEYAGDQLLHMDMQKDTIVQSISSVMLNPSGENTAVTISGIEEVFVNGEPLGLGGYLDIGLHDTMKDLFVNLIGAVVFSVIGFFYVKNRGRGSFARQFIPVVPQTEQGDESPEVGRPEAAGNEPLKNAQPEAAGTAGGRSEPV
ncbi:MAG: hypothetical protein ACI4MR_06485 [Candidatus Aphodomorpha sp.]